MWLGMTNTKQGVKTIEGVLLTYRANEVRPGLQT